MNSSKIIKYIKSIPGGIWKIIAAVMLGMVMGMGLRHDPNTEVKKSGKSTSQDK